MMRRRTSALTIPIDTMPPVGRVARRGVFCVRPCRAFFHRFKFTTLLIVGTSCLPSLPGRQSQGAETSSARREMVRSSEQIQDEISALLRRLADPVQAGESVKVCIRRASQRAGLPYGQVKRAWYKEWRNIPAHVADEIRERAAIHDRRLQQEAFQAIIALQDSDPDYYRQCIEEVGDILLPVSGKRRAAGPPD
jgi:hypothetical protein